MEWSETYCYTSHYGWSCVATARRWATVQMWGEFTELTCWISGMGFSQPQYTFYGKNNEKNARQMGEKWVNLGSFPKESKTIIKTR